MDELATVYKRFTVEYVKNIRSNSKLLMIDALLVYAVLSGLVQVIFAIFVGSFPFNSFLSGFICQVAIFALGVSLRLQLTSSSEFKNISPERAYGDFALCCLVLFFMVFSFMG